MSQCLFAHFIAAVFVICGALLVIFAPMHSYYRIIKASPFASCSQPLDFAENLKSEQFLEMCEHDCTKYPLVFAKTCADLQNVQIHNRSAPLLLLYKSESNGRCSATVTKATLNRKATVVKATVAPNG